MVSVVCTAAAAAAAAATQVQGGHLSSDDNSIMCFMPSLCKDVWDRTADEVYYA
jgi:hypothetical protein